VVQTLRRKQTWGIEKHSLSERSAKPHDLITALERISNLLSWTRDNLHGFAPPFVSQAADIAAVQTIGGNPISLKALISSLGCSEAGLRGQLQRLLDEGPVVIDRNSVDQRVRRVVATQKLLDAIIKLAARIAGHERQMESAQSAFQAS